MLDGNCVDNRISTDIIKSPIVILTSQEKAQQKLDYIFGQAPYLEIKNQKYHEIKESISNKVWELLALRWFDSISIEKFKHLDIRVASQKMLLEISSMDWNYGELLSYMSEKYEYFKRNYGNGNCENNADYENRCKSIIDDLIELWIVVREGDNLSYRFKNKPH